MSGQTIRQQYMKRFAELQRSDDTVAVAIVAGYLLQIVASFGFGYWLLHQTIDTVAILGLIANAIFLGTRFRGLNNIVHECSHSIFAKSRKVNVVCGSICASLIMGCFQDYRDEHLTHHRHLGDYDKDMDLHGIEDLELEAPLTPRTLLRHLVTPLIGRHLPYYLHANLSARDGHVYRWLKVALLGASVLYLILDPIPALVLVWVPFAWVFTTINYWTDCIDHGGLLKSPDELEASRNILMPKPLRAILFPRNDSFHLIHHLFPQVPTQHFDACHDILLNNPEYLSRTNAAGWAVRVNPTGKALSEVLH